MKRINTSPISGTQELLPCDQVLFNRYKSQVEEAFSQHGFLNIETPVIERGEVLFAKAGGETEKQIYRVFKTGESAEESDQALRFDHTVPLARYVAEHESSLAFPFRVTQSGRNFRGERAQRGRFREFYQLDIDVVGRGELAIEYDAEVILTLFEALERFVAPKKLVRVSNRKILSGMFEELNLQEVKSEIFSIVDHAEKVAPEKTLERLNSLGIGEERVATLVKFLEIAGSREEVTEKLRGFGFTNAEFLAGVEELESVMRILEAQGLGDSVIANMRIVRGLDYYTGTVFETILPEYKEIGSICSGGRYDDLAGLYTDQRFPGVGGSIGLTRLFFILNEYGLLGEEKAAPVELAIIPVGREQIPFCFKLAETERAKGKTVDLVLLDKKLGDKLKYAAKVAKFGMVVGETEVETGNLTLKNFATGESFPAK